MSADGATRLHDSADIVAWADAQYGAPGTTLFPRGAAAEVGLIVLGGPAMLIGLGGGAASSMASGSGNEDLDFASVQRDNAEMERRCQEVIDRCWALGDANPISFIHDVGAGGVSNALPELVNDGGRGGKFKLRAVPNDEPGMSPLEIWCNESQERYVLAVPADPGTVSFTSSENWRKGEDLIAIRSQLLAEYRTGALRLGAELYDSRVYGVNRLTVLSTTDVNAFEPVQAYAALDLNSDGKPDIIASGRASKNLVIYWNQSP